MQKYGKTLYNGRFSPIFYKFATKKWNLAISQQTHNALLQTEMKYYKTTFKLYAADAETFSTARDICTALCGNVGYESFQETPQGFEGYIQRELFDPDALAGELAGFPFPDVEIRYTTEEVEDRNWNEEWEKEGFEPIVFGDRCIIHDLQHSLDRPYPIDITIDARQAFGTGTHNTTRMIVGALLETSLAGKDVLDCGCGTGILSIVASKCGAQSVSGYDIDEWSVENTAHNAALNGARNVKAFKGDASILEGEMSGKYDLVLANINRNILLGDMPLMAGCMKEGARLIMSGFYAEDAEVLEKRASQLGLRLEDTEHSDRWTMLKFVKETKTP